MKVFISWSGERSKRVAELTSAWLKCVIQASEPWVSTQDIDRGALWNPEINEQLNNSLTGIICLTKENKNNPWILFESGALAKGLSNSRICTLLIDLEHADIKPPLAQFNHTLPNEVDILKLLKTINKHLGDGALDEQTLGNVFKQFWPVFESEFKGILEKTTEGNVEPPRTNDDILTEILESTRSLSKRMHKLEGMSLGGQHVRPVGLLGQASTRPLTALDNSDTYDSTFYNKNPYSDTVNSSASKILRAGLHSLANAPDDKSDSDRDK